MKNKQIALLLLLGTSLAALPALRAADKPGAPGGERRERMQQGAERISEALGLSADQKARMQEINQQQRAELEALRDDTTLAKGDRQAKAKAIQEKYKGQRDSLLTGEQRAKADAMREKGRDRMENRRERMKEGAAGAGGPGGNRREKKGGT